MLVCTDLPRNRLVSSECKYIEFFDCTYCDLAYIAVIELNSFNKLKDDLRYSPDRTSCVKWEFAFMHPVLSHQVSHKIYSECSETKSSGWKVGEFV